MNKMVLYLKLWLTQFILQSKENFIKIWKKSAADINAFYNRLKNDKGIVSLLSDEKWLMI
jgi:hypothetical protein